MGRALPSDRQGSLGHLSERLVDEGDELLDSLSVGGTT